MSDTAVLSDHREQPAQPVPQRILVLAPTGEDASLIAEILASRDLEVVVVADAAELAREISAGAGVALIASEALDEPEAATELQAALALQEPWSEMPVILFAGAVEDSASLSTEMLGTRAQVVLLERPLGIATFLTVTDAALRSRRRQYEVNQLLDALAESAAMVTRAHEAATRMKDEFLATIGHELRSPMTAIRGWVQLLKEGSLDAEEAATALSMIDSSTKVQARIIEDLMDLSRIMAGKVMIEPARVELNPALEMIVATFRSAAALQQINLSADLSAGPLFAWADETRLQQIGWNLISNAIKFTPRGGSVHVTLRRDDATAVIHVTDTGEGIAPEVLPYIFERYRQEGNAPGKQQKGLGLGLAIVRHLVESHGGTIRAVSEGKGKGSEFVVSLPLLS